ncbi:hypothetical protein [Paenibacillus odorifer]|uniref:hypothetical protein n=2 Tax=Paenibacillus odorifer TaxID=189426 RepID=UPI00117FF236|nr:hypothetical protein [Paenibacillus odorifer]
MEELGEMLQERLDKYNERMEALERAKEALESLRDTFSEFEEALGDLENAVYYGVIARQYEGGTNMLNTITWIIIGAALIVSVAALLKDRGRR